MALPLAPTLNDLRGELQARLGFGNQGPPSTLGRANLHSIIGRAQEQVWDELQWAQRHTAENIDFVTGQTLYDWPDAVAPEWLTRISVLYASVWQRMHRGIEHVHDTFTATSPSFPQRYDFKGSQLEIWPDPDQDYTGRIEYYPRLGDLTLDDDRATVPGRLLFALALYQAKLHYRQPDAEAYAGAYERMKRRIQIGQARGQRYITPTRRRPRHVDDSTADYQGEPRARPVMDV